jgi:hypothetical protein
VVPNKIGAGVAQLMTGAALFTVKLMVAVAVV